MSRKKRMQNLREQKDRRMKKVAIGAGVVLVAVLAFQMKHMLGGSKSSAPAPATTTATTADTGAPTTGTPTVTPAGTAAAAVLPTTGSTKLPNTDAGPKRSKSQIYVFGDFSGKDPFAQQISTASGSTGTSGSSTGTSTSAPAAPTSSATVDASVKSLPGSSSSRMLARTGAVTISVNGRSESVRMGASFPRSNPLFRLVSISHGVVRIGIAAGSYASGAQTVTLVAGRTLTLVDTSDGIRYKLRLLSAA